MIKTRPSSTILISLEHELGNQWGANLTSWNLLPLCTLSYQLPLPLLAFCLHIQSYLLPTCPWTFCHIRVRWKQGACNTTYYCTLMITSCVQVRPGNIVPPPCSSPHHLSCHSSVSQPKHWDFHIKLISSGVQAFRKLHSALISFFLILIYVIRDNKTGKKQNVHNKHIWPIQYQSQENVIGCITGLELNHF